MDGSDADGTQKRHAHRLLPSVVRPGEWKWFPYVGRNRNSGISDDGQTLDLPWTASRIREIGWDVRVIAVREEGIDVLPQIGEILIVVLLLCTSLVRAPRYAL